MPGGLWLNNAPSWDIINAMWISLIKWHGDKLMCSLGDWSLRVPIHSLEMSRPPSLVMWLAFAHRVLHTGPCTEDIHRNLTLISLSCLSPQMSRGVWYAGMCLPSLAQRKRKGFVYSQAPSSLIHIIFSCRGAKAWKQPRERESAASFHLICLLVLLV